MSRQPLYPHIPNIRKPVTRLPDDGLRFLPDSPEFLAETITCTGCRDKLECAFQEAIKRAKGVE